MNVLMRDFTEPWRAQLGELTRLLHERGVDAVTLWAEVVRPHGAVRFRQHFEAEDLAREYTALEHALLVAYANRYGQLDGVAVGFISELVGEAISAVQGSYARVLRTEEIRFREASLMESVLHHVDVGIWVAEADGTLSYATPPVARLLGLPLVSLMGAQAREALPRLLQRLHAQHPSGRPFLADELPLFVALKGMAPVRDVGMVIHRPLGDEKVFLEMSATPLLQEGEPPAVEGVIQVMVDRTDSAQKARALADAYDELQRLQGRLLQRTRTQALGQLASGTAHALNNFLNVLRLRITLLRRDAKKEHLDALDQTVRKIGDLVSRLQELSVPPPEGELAVVEVDGVLRDALELAREELSGGGKPLTLKTSLLGHGWVRADRGYLRELLVNLLLTARDRMPDGGTLTVSTRAERGNFVLDLEDTGPRYDEEELKRLFDPLKGAASHLQLSMLLAVARTQLRQWSGELSCDNCKGEAGAVLHLTLPLAKGIEAPAPLPRAVRQAPSAHARVLVVDDEQENARMLAEVLNDEGYQATIAQTGDEALRLWAAQPFDVALLDAVMPDVSGWQLARELRARSPKVLLAIVTGLDIRGQNRSNLALVDAVFQKPVEVEALEEFLGQTGVTFEAPPQGVH
jgi:signal transduction histidine kinase